jgi:uncharacterized membrane protein YhhN
VAEHFRGPLVTAVVAVALMVFGAVVAQFGDIGKVLGGLMLLIGGCALIFASVTAFRRRDLGRPD